MEQFVSSINDPINGIVWGWPMVLLIAFTGVLLMLGLRFMPLQRLPYGIRMLLQRDASQNDGDITPPSAPATLLVSLVPLPSVARALCSGCG